MEDQQLVQNFLREFSEKIAEKFNDDLDFILLFGSAARGEWKKGVSDVDLIIQVKTQGAIYNVKTYADKIFWELDEKYGTELKKVCSTGDEKDKIKTLIKQTKLYVPYEVFGPKDIDWIKGKIKRRRIMKKKIIIGIIITVILSLIIFLTTKRIFSEMILISISESQQNILRFEKRISFLSW